MTAHVHDPATHGGVLPGEVTPAEDAAMTSSRPRWLVPGVLVAIAIAGLVVAGVLSLSTVLYVGLFGGMILMHMGGHGGHGGGHGGHGGGPASHGGGPASRGQRLHDDGAGDPDDLSRRSSGAQPTEPRSASGLDQRAPSNPAASETDDHDQHRSHGCH